MALAELTITLLTKLVVIIIFTPIFVFPSMFISIFGFFLGNFYLRAQLSVKREMRYAIAVYYIVYRSHMLFSNARSPVLAHFSAAIAGIGKVHPLVNPNLNMILFSTSFNSRVRCSGFFQKRVSVTSESLHSRRSNVL